MDGNWKGVQFLAYNEFDFLGTSENTAIRELACKHMEYADPMGAREFCFFDPMAPDKLRYDAASPHKVRNAALDKWKGSWKRRFIDQ